MGYVVFARRWRPQNFDQVIAQEHIATTLKNAIALNRVGHAYLFTGPRGVGKTSMARILAKALNCQNGPAAEPCNACDSCREISAGRSLDVMEIDGASNRGIEQIRQLRENVKFAPAKSRFKVYIIDEVHQITTDGFNALLKTLEEPPAHVKFIFATTQTHKVLPTILSRCQRFNFKPLTILAITAKLNRIIKEEKMAVTEEAVSYIAKAAAGSMRDAESILDQLSSFAKGKVNLSMVTSMLGMIEFEAVEEIAQKIIEKKTAEALVLVEKVINQGKGLAQFVTGMMEHFRNILVAKTLGAKAAAELVDLPKEQLARIKEQAGQLTLPEILYIFNLLLRAQESLRRALSSRIIVEMAVVKLTQRQEFLSLDEILTRLGRLEQGLAKGSVAVQANPGEEKTFSPITNEQPAASDNPGSESMAASEQLDYTWSDFLQRLKEEKMFVASSLEFGQMVSLEEGVLTIAFPEKCNFYKETLEQQENKKIIEDKAKQVFGRDLRVKFILDKSLTKEQKKEQASAASESSEPIIQSALKIFQGRILRRSE